MNDEPRSPERGAEVLSTLPRSRPHRRSSKRPASGASALAEPPARPVTPTKAQPRKPAASRPRAAGAGRPERLRQPPQPRGLPPKPEPAPTTRPEPADASRPAIVATAVQAAAELAEIGLTLSARALRGAVSRLPRP